MLSLAGRYKFRILFLKYLKGNGGKIAHVLSVKGSGPEMNILQ